VKNGHKAYIEIGGIRVLRFHRQEVWRERHHVL